MKKGILNNKELYKKMVIIFFMIMPLFDVIYFYNHLTTFIRIFLITILLIWTIYLYRDSHKNLKYLIIYYLLIAVYLAINYFRSSNFNSLIPGNFNYSVISEAFTLIKLSVPFTLMYILNYVEFKKKDYFLVIKTWVILIAGSIVLLNILKCSLSSYTNEFVKYSIFSWGQNLPYTELATKGLFAYANQEAVIMLLLLIISIYNYLTNNKKRNIFYIILLTLGMLMLGTRISTYGGNLVFIGIYLFYFIFQIINKSKINKKSLLLIPIILVWLLVLPLSPNSSRVGEINQSIEKIETTEIDESATAVGTTNIINNVPIDDELKEFEEKIQSPICLCNELTLEEKMEYIEKKYNSIVISDNFYKDFYPYQYDPDFWVDIVNTQQKVYINYRYLELKIIQRVVENNDDKFDILFGITNTRIQNIVNIERDIILQYYAFGIIGFIVIMLYYIYNLYLLIKKTVMKKTYLEFCLLSSLIFYLVCAFMSGNIINFLAPMIPLCFIINTKYNTKD